MKPAVESLPVSSNICLFFPFSFKQVRKKRWLLSHSVHSIRLGFHVENELPALCSRDTSGRALMTELIRTESEPPAGSPPSRRPASPVALASLKSSFGETYSEAGTVPKFSNSMKNVLILKRCSNERFSFMGRQGKPELFTNSHMNFLFVFL